MYFDLTGQAVNGTDLRPFDLDRLDLLLRLRGDLDLDRLKQEETY